MKIEITWLQTMKMSTLVDLQSDFDISSSEISRLYQEWKETGISNPEKYFDTMCVCVCHVCPCVSVSVCDCDIALPNILLLQI